MFDLSPVELEFAEGLLRLRAYFPYLQLGRVPLIAGWVDNQAAELDHGVSNWRASQEVIAAVVEELAIRFGARAGP